MAGDRQIRREMQRRIDRYLDLTLDERANKRRAVRKRFDWRLPGEFVIPWTRRQQQARKKGRP